MLWRHLLKGRAIAIDRTRRPLVSLFAVLTSAFIALPCQGKAIIQRWQRDSATPPPVSDVSLPT
ncbi:MAG TPA: hypothetical protein DD435_02920, partial [Cyanobacteria bacterium UBA8530]|nr:hypothetical protein [Cyanobacteria bacterium UBA8530]